MEPIVRPRAHLGFGVTAGYGPGILEPLAAEVARLGYESFWCNDSARPEGDGLADLAVVHRVAPSLVLGVGVVPLDRRPPARIADDVTRLGLPVAQLRLGIGSGAEAAQPVALVRRRRAGAPLALVRAGVGELRAGLPGARVFVAALGPRMCELAGEVADGVLLNWALPARLDWARERIRAGATAAGRDLDAIEVWAYVRSAVGPDARARLAVEAARYARSPAYGRQFSAMDAPLEAVGVAGPDLGRQLEAYRDRLDGVVVRALPATPTLDDLLAIAVAAA